MGYIVAYPTHFSNRLESRAGIVEDINRDWRNPATGETEVALKIRATHSSGNPPSGKAQWVRLKNVARVLCPFDPKEGEE